MASDPDGTRPDVFVDHRERANELLDALQHLGFKVQIGQLRLGDYRIARSTLVERKTIDDFCLSLLDGRLFAQAYRLAVAAESPVLLLEGGGFPERRFDVSIEAIRGALATLAQSFRIPILRSRDQRDSAWLIGVLARQRARLGTGEGARVRRRPRRLKRQRMYLLRCLPGVGPKIARRLLDEFGTVERVACAETNELAAVPGLGTAKATRIHALFHEAEDVISGA